MKTIEIPMREFVARAYRIQDRIANILPREAFDASEQLLADMACADMVGTTIIVAGDCGCDDVYTVVNVEGCIWVKNTKTGTLHYTEWGYTWPYYSVSFDPASGKE